MGVRRPAWSVSTSPLSASQPSKEAPWRCCSASLEPVRSAPLRNRIDKNVRGRHTIIRARMEDPSDLDLSLVAPKHQTRSRFLYNVRAHALLRISCLHSATSRGGISGQASGPRSASPGGRALPNISQHRPDVFTRLTSHRATSSSMLVAGTCMCTPFPRRPTASRRARAR